MADRLVKSTIWIASFGGIAYLLQLLTTPSAEKIEKIKAGSGSSAHLSEDEKKKILFMKRLKDASTGPPIYLPKKDQ